MALLYDQPYCKYDYCVLFYELVTVFKIAVECTSCLGVRGSYQRFSFEIAERMVARKQCKFYGGQIEEVVKSNSEALEGREHTSL